MPPVISIVLPVYNRDLCLSTTIQSILNQTYLNFELIIWDDASTDRSRAIAQQFAHKTHGFTLLPHPIKA